MNLSYDGQGMLMVGRPGRKKVVGKVLDPDAMEFIVRAVNAHDKLVATLRQCLNALTDETGNEAEREYEAAVAARAVLVELKEVA